MPDSSLVLVAIAGAAYIFWLVFHRYLVRSPLDNLPSPPSSPFLGNLPDIIHRQSHLWWRHVSNTYGPATKLTAFFGIQMLYTFDPKAMYSILVKDTELYPKKTAAYDDFTLFIGPGLLFAEGAQHRRQRKWLNPVFSVAQLRDVSHVFYGVAYKLEEAIRNRVGAQSQNLDVNGWMARTTLEMLGQAGLGYSFDKFTEDSTDSYGEALKSFFPVINHVPLLNLFVMTLANHIPKWLMRRVLRLAVPFPHVLRLLRISETMQKRSSEIIQQKKTALQKGDKALIHQVGEGKDIMSVLLKSNMNAPSDSEKLPDEELLAQMSTFILAGMDTTSNALSRILHLLAEHPDVQEKLRHELSEAREIVGNGKDVPYDDLVKLPYLDAVCRETLRLHPPLNLIGRRAAKDMVVPLSSPVRGRDGTLVNEVTLPKDTFVLLGLQACNTNKKLWGEDAYEWKPERWLQPLPSMLEEARVPGVYSNLMSFSGGVRSCIGFKFSQLEMKVLLTILLPAFSFELTEKPIFWNTSAVSYPTMDKDSTRPEMLLKVKALAC
uniref:Ganoderic acid synthetase CYP5150L8 n=1 Tax=Ganoderma lucidum TaxID=5315 RepID=CYPL8_GANLU|nr:RecName: Full=Ganoderic acid synthetase CYP5150L8; AltName: Full=Cytochrome P450 monooxygenase CYP5150L8 [Ganoderma lucidum]AVZ44872.1 ganoderic acid Z synthetase CYP5150L8 [Ganoderma lucidum]